MNNRSSLDSKREKKDIFNGKIKKEWVANVLISIILGAVIFFGACGMLLYVAIAVDVDKATRLGFLLLGAACFFLGIWYFFGTFFVIRRYPKYKKRIKWFLNSEYYFVGCDSPEVWGHRRGRHAFGMAGRLADRNKDMEDIKYPKQYGVFIILTVVGIVLLFVNIVGVWLALKNIETLPKMFQSEYTVFAAFIVCEVLDGILSFIFAFKVKSIRDATIKEYREKMRLKNKSRKQKVGEK